MATFRDLAAEADRQLVGAAQRVGTMPQAEAAAAAAELAAIARTCRRILDDVLDAQPNRTDDGPGWIQAAQQSRAHIQAAAAQLGQAADAYMIDAPLLAHHRGPAKPLRQAVRNLRLAEEFLQTHLTSAPQGNRVPKARAQDGLSDPLAARELVALTGRWIGLVAKTSDLVSHQVQVPRKSFRVDVKPLTRLLRQAANCAAVAHKTIVARTGLPDRIGDRVAIAPNTRRSTDAAQQGEVLRLLTRAAQDAHLVRSTYQAAQRGDRRAKGADLSAKAMRYVATSTGSACSSAAIIARELAACAADQAGTDRSPQAQALGRAADALTATAHAWHAASREWDRLTTHKTRIGVAAESAMGIALRLGRVAFADPDWTPASRGSQVRAGAALAPDSETLNVAVHHLHRLVTEFTGTARATCTAIDELRADGALRTHAPNGRNRIAPDELAAVTRIAYAEGARHSAVAVRHLQEAATLPGRRPAEAPTLAAIEFPDPPLAHPGQATDTPRAADGPAQVRQARRA